jgi:hypothetical protein
MSFHDLLFINQFNRLEAHFVVEAFVEINKILALGDLKRICVGVFGFQVGTIFFNFFDFVGKFDFFLLFGLESLFISDFVGVKEVFFKQINVSF